MVSGVIVAFTGGLIFQGRQEPVAQAGDVALGGFGGDLELFGQPAGVGIAAGLDLVVKPEKALDLGKDGHLGYRSLSAGWWALLSADVGA